MHVILLALFLLGSANGSNASGTTGPQVDRVKECESLSGPPGSSVTVHGRLYAANGGGSGFRIWLVGTHRIVWLSPRIAPAIPDAILGLFKPFDEELYGDFRLVPLAPDRPGFMREMCFVSADKLVVRDTRTGKAWYTKQ